MFYKNILLIVIYFFLSNCTTTTLINNKTNNHTINGYSNKGFALVYRDTLYEKILQWNRSLRFGLAVCTLKEKFDNVL